MIDQIEPCPDCGGPVVTSVFEGNISSFYSVDYQCECTKMKIPEPKFLDKALKRIKESINEQERASKKSN